VGIRKFLSDLLELIIHLDERAMYPSGPLPTEVYGEAGEVHCCANAPYAKGRRPIAGTFVGDWTCAYNARSAQLRCAVNPVGPCERCPHYKPREDV
jgi:hypothetical protein